MFASTDLDYLARRAEREAVLAVSATDGRVAAAHEEMSRRYARRLLATLTARASGWDVALPG